MHISAYEACLERVAEELMGRRKWKHIQELHTKSHMNTEETNKLTTTNTEATKAENLSVGAAETISAEDRQKLNEEKITHSDLNLLESSENKHMQKEQIYTITKKDEDKEVKEDKDIDKEKQHHKESSQDKKENETAAPVEHILEHKTENETKSASGELAATETAPLEPAIENNNNKGEPESSDITKTETRKSSESERLKSVESPPPAEPIDWKPDDKCNFCINGKLLTVNDKGELVAESGPAMSETEAQRLDTDSDSDVSSSNQAGSVNATEVGDHRRLDLAKLLTSRQREFPANMASINSLSPQLATNFPVFQNLNWLQLAQQTAQQLNAATPTTSDISAAALSPSLKDSPSPSDATGEQPLDLSSKPSPNSSTCGDLKVVRPKSSRSTPLLSSSGRRTYSDEDLNNALQDVLSGKSGTRKAAVRYSVPRSTLRNKMQALQNPQQMEVDNSDEDGEENDAESSASVQQTNEATEQSFDETFQMALLKKLSENNGNATTYDNASASSTTKNANKLQNNTAPLLAEALAQGTQPAALLQALMLVSNFGGLDDRVSVRDLLSALLINTSGTGLKATSTTDATSDANAENSNLNNGRTANLIAQRLLYQQLQQQENQQQQQRTSSPYATTQHRLATSDTPETNSSSLDAHDDEQSSILKIPSYKPVAGSNTREHSISPTPTLVNHNNNNNANSLNSNLHRNGDSPQSALSPRIPTSLLAANLNVNSTRQSNIPVISPPLPSHQSLGSADSQSPPSMCFRDMIANSIHRTMSDQASKDSQGDYKKPSISVVKNIGGTDTSRFGAAPNVLAVVGAAAAGGAMHHNHQSQFHLHSHHSSHHLSRAEAAALAAGKGTRPKRGKYRNYDRDSLVEAVKAVQRGEMSVHRAGSYYGVPHSTLEYKVKERHLMRPRKREPKPQPGLDGSSTGGNASTSKSNSNIPGLQNSLDKMKVGGGGAAGASSNLKQLNNALKNNSNSALNYTSASQNGMKLPLFDPATMAQYAPQFFWQHGPTAAFNQLQMDLNRNAAAAAAQSSVAHMQRLRDEAAMAGGNANSPSPATSPMSSQNHHHPFTPETLYEGAGTNGSFLDGIIRKSLDRKASIDLTSNAANNAAAGVGSSSSGALLDQLVKKSPLPFTNNRVANDFAATNAVAGGNAFGPAFPTATAGGTKRSSSPPAFPGIKRERSSPPPLTMQASSDDEETIRGKNELPTLLEHNNNNKNNNNNSNGNGRVNHAGSDSEHDIVSMTGCLEPHNTHATNGGNDAAMPKTKSATSPLLSLTETKAGAVVPPPTPPSQPPQPTTSILQEKLAQIKSEQHETEINL